MKDVVNLSNFNPKEEKDMTKVFLVNIWVKKTKVDSLFDFSSHANLIAKDIISKIVL
jgi:hypothetical protein